ncbi:MAG: hypothetical protein K2M12_02960 [Muribaculaceae bacterium]|nr:hypothetical protein [Muribaculaceae bacterium]
MKALTKYVTALVLAGCAAGVRAADFELTCRRSERAFDYGEWAQAAALSQIAIDMRPDSAALYARGIVAYDMMADTTAGVALLENAMAHGVALDDVVGAVRNEAFAIGHADIYDSFLQRTRARMPWMARAIDARRLDHYMLRGDGERVVLLAGSMLEGLPGNVHYMSLLARGYDMQGLTARADETRRRILEAEPDNVEALRALGCSLLHQGHRAEARRLLEHAQRLAPTPYIEKLLNTSF